MAYITAYIQRQVACGQRHTVFLDERGRIWSLGDNHHGNTHSHPTVALDGVQCCFDTYGRGD